MYSIQCPLFTPLNCSLHPVTATSTWNRTSQKWFSFIGSLFCTSSIIPTLATLQWLSVLLNYQNLQMILLLVLFAQTCQHERERSIRSLFKQWHDKKNFCMLQANVHISTYLYAKDKHTDIWCMFAHIYLHAHSTPILCNIYIDLYMHTFLIDLNAFIHWE